MQKAKRFSFSNFNDNMYALTALAILAAFTLSWVSFLRLCSEQCTEGHNYLLFGQHFEPIGLAFFTILGLLHVLQRKYAYLSQLEAILFSCALGAEFLFILVQKYSIGTWCPVCLGIAACVFIGTCCFTAYDAKNTQREERMKFYKSGIKNITAIVLGFFIAFMGVSKHDAMQAAQESVQDSLAFGNKNSKIEVYLFTDWMCPACRKLEPEMEHMAMAITSQAKLIFIDAVVHPETLNFIPFNLSFMIHNKKEYFKLRNMLTSIAKDTKEPTEKQIAAEAAKFGVIYIEPHYSDIALAVEYYKQLGEKFEIKSTPTMVFVNREAKKGKRLIGDAEITKENIAKTLEEIKAIE